jgi:hypothetical protein
MAKIYAICYNIGMNLPTSVKKLGSENRPYRPAWVEPPANLPVANDEADFSPPLTYPKTAKPPVTAGLSTLSPEELKPEEIFEPKQEPPRPLTEEDKKEAAALEALSLRPRHLLPEIMRRIMIYPAEHPSPRLADDFKRYHRKTIDAFDRTADNPVHLDQKISGFRKYLKKFADCFRQPGARRQAKKEHELAVILAFARHKRKITNNDVKTLIGAGDRPVAAYLDQLVAQGDLIRSGSEITAFYKPTKY